MLSLTGWVAQDVVLAGGVFKNENSIKISGERGVKKDTKKQWYIYIYIYTYIIKSRWQHGVPWLSPYIPIINRSWQIF